MGIHEEKLQLKDDVAPTSGPVTVRARSNLLATVVVGMVTLVIGVLAGYFGRPLVTPQPLNPTPVALADTATPSVASDANPSPSTVMDAVVAQTRHFKGDPNAPITIIEFGDFQ